MKNRFICSILALIMLLTSCATTEKAEETEQNDNTQTSISETLVDDEAAVENVITEELINDVIENAEEDVSDSDNVTIEMIYPDISELEKEIHEISFDNQTGTYTSIKMSDAPEVFAQSNQYIIVDVRRDDEYSEGHIPGAVNLPLNDITEETAQEVLPDKESYAFIYCRSGVRSKGASEKLVKLGYTNIIEIGGIIDWTGEIEY